MIITVTCNPAIDKTVYENKTVFDVGGKGINVAKVLNNLDTKCIATGFIGRDNKEVVLNDLNSLGIDNHFIEVEGIVRTNTKTIINNELFEDNVEGCFVSDDDINALFDYLKTFKNEIFVISGSAPKNVRKTIYKEMLDVLKQNNNYIILDVEKDFLRNAITSKPNMIKPNKDEICEFFNTEYNEQTIIEKCKEFNFDLICLSLGSEGAIFIAGDDVYKCDPLKINYSSAVGAGDSMVAALSYSKLNNYNIEDTIKLAMACASAACETEGTKPPKKADILSKLSDVIYKKQ